MKIEFPELYKKFLEMYWDGDINNALKLDDSSRTHHQNEVDRDLDRPESFSDFVTQRSMEVSGQVNKIYDAEEYWCVYLEKVFIVDEGTKVLRFEFGGAIHYPKSSPLPCKPGGMYSFSGRIGSADYSWLHMNPRHIYAPYGFMNGVDYLCLDLVLKDATCISASGSVYTGRSFGLLGGERAEVPGQFSHPPLPGQFSPRPLASTNQDGESKIFESEGFVVTTERFVYGSKIVRLDDITGGAGAYVDKEWKGTFFIVAIGLAMLAWGGAFWKFIGLVGLAGAYFFFKFTTERSLVLSANGEGLHIKVETTELLNSLAEAINRGISLRKGARASALRDELSSLPKRAGR